MWEDSAVFGNPHALSYEAGTDTSFDVVGNTEGRTIYYQHETGTDQVQGGATTAIVASIESGDFDITQQRSSQGQQTGVATLRGDGEFLMKIRRFVPDFDMLQKGGESVPISDLKIMSDKARRSMAKRFLKKYGEEWVRINILENEDLK